MNWRGLRHRAEFFVFRGLVCLFEALSPRRSAQLANVLALVIHRVLPRKFTRYQVAHDNLRIAFGNRVSVQQIDAIIYRMWVHLFRMVTEMVQLRRKLRLGNLFDTVTFRNREMAVGALNSGRPVILLSGHFGNWEMAVSVFGLFGFRMGVVARELDNPYLNEWFRKFRQSTGHAMLAKKGGYDDMLTMLQQRGHLAILGDQDAGRRGMFVDFFGQPASTFKSIALFAAEYRAIICVGYARRLPDDFVNSDCVKYEIGCEAVVDPLEIDGDDPIREITQQFTSALERVVRRSPEQYFWLHRRWKSAPGQPRRRRVRHRKAG